MKNWNHILSRLGALFLLICLLLANSPFVAQAGSAPAPTGQTFDDALQRLMSATGGTARVSLSRATGRAQFIRLQPGSLPFNLKTNTEGAALEEAMAFLRQHGAVFGSRNPQAELEILPTLPDATGARHVSYRQVYRGVPVFAGVLRVHFDPQGRLSAANGVFIPDINLEVTPRLTPAEAAQAASARVTRQVAEQRQATPADLGTADPTLYIYRTNLARGLPGEARLVYEVEVSNGLDVREFVYVDARTGKIADQITGTYEALNRRVYSGGLGDSYLVWKEGDPYPFTGTDSTGINRLIDYSEDIYNVISSLSGGAYLSWDGQDSTMHSVYRAPGISCPNANWNGVSTNFCYNVDGDDTVAHEWGHAYTQATHHLIYMWQSGAINESYSDIWGEVVDLLNGAGKDSGGKRSNGGCSVYGFGSPRTDSSYRWLSGEDDVAFGRAIRDMWNPACYGDAGKVSDTAYQCSSDDQGGVHANCGVPNHAFALLVDGGSYNNIDMGAGIGIPKAANIYWRAQTVYQVPSTDFADHADALEQSCQDLIGQPIYEPTTQSPTGAIYSQTITAADCNLLANAIAAVELRREPTQCNFQPLLDTNPPALCSAGSVPVSIAATDWEGGLGRWTAGTRNVANPATFDTPDWAVVGPLPDGRAGQAAFVNDDSFLGDCDLDDESGVLYLESPDILLPAGVSPKLAIDQWVATEFEWDGGNFKIRVNGGAWTLIPASAFTFNDYNISLVTTDNTNPLAGQSAFSGTDGGENSGTWAQSQIDLSSLAQPGDTIRLRVEFGLDGCNGVLGWYIDDVNVYRCTTQAPTTVYVDDSYTSATSGISLDRFTSIQDGLNAAAAGGTVRIAAGTYTEPVVLSKNVTVIVDGDITLNGSLTLQAGSFTAPAGTLTLAGDFSRSGGSFNPNGGTLVFSGAAVHSLSLGLATTFHNLTVASGATLVETQAANNATVSGVLTNQGTIRKSLSISGSGGYDFGLAQAAVQVNTVGTLTSLQVERIDQNHPNAGSTHLQTGKYWNLTPNSGAAGFNTSLTLTVGFTPATDGSDKLCRYTGQAGDPYPFECGQTAENSADAATRRITRTNVTGFSSWTAGKGIAPTQIELSDMAARPAADQYLWLLPGLAVAGLAGLFVRRKSG